MLELRHGHLDLALHELRAGTGLALLLLHALGEDSSTWETTELPWPGPVYGLDFSGHGDSERAKGVVYLPEYWVGDADAALIHLESAAILGSGLGAYVAVLAAGVRPSRVITCGLLPGHGLAGGGPEPRFDQSAYETFLAPDLPEYPRAGPRVGIGGATMRPPGYVGPVARAARALVLGDGDERPPWWQVLRGLDNVALVEASPAAVCDGMSACLPRGA